MGVLVSYVQYLKLEVWGVEAEMGEGKVLFGVWIIFNLYDLIKHVLSS